MKITNFLLIILIGRLLFPKIKSVQEIPTISQEKAQAISIKPIQYKDITPSVKNEKEIKHSTTFSSYVDSDTRSTIGVHHNIRIGKEYYLTGGVTARQNSFGDDDYGVNFSCTKYW